MAGADQVVCPFFVVVFERLNSLIYNVQIRNLGPLVKELKKLFKTFLKIKEVLDDAEEKQFHDKAVRVRVWLQELNDAAYEADDVLDDFEYEEGLQQLASEEATSSSNNVSELHGKIQTLNKKFHELAEECSGLELRKEKEKSVVVSPERTTISLSTEPKVHGRDEDREKLVKQLLRSDYLTLDQFRTQRSNYFAKHPKASWGPVLNEASSSSSKDPISVFPILGMGGVGKTTLAQLVYNDERVENHFKHRSWICVSDDFDIKRLMKAIVASISGSECNLEDLERLQQRLRKEVHGKRFLLVLDDVWEESQEEWNKMARFFEGGAQGSSIIVTTRLERVASITSSLDATLRLNCLSRKDCWALFKQYAFGPGNEESEALVKIGEAIVEKCGGLPLAAKSMGGLLRFKNEENEWLEVKDSAVWELPQSSGKEGILPALRLSYYHLPSTLKQCFVYCSIFPKDFSIEKETLIELWMANGLVQSRAKMELEDVGNENFTALLHRSFFQDIEEGINGGIICKMHDLVHDLASYIAGDEYFVDDLTERTRHLSSYGKVPSTSMLKSVHGSLPCLRSLIMLNRKHVTLKFVFSDFILLRALDLHSCEIEVVPDCIGEMIHLRYLDLSMNSFTSLPESICLLRNMQTLKLKECFFLESLPKNLRNMSNLRLLDIQGCDWLTEMPIGIAQLTCLRRLSDFIVCEGSRIGELQLLNNLRGELIIKRLGVVETSTEAKEANLMSKKNLHLLDLRWALGPGSYSDDDSELDSEQQQQHHQNVIEGLQPHSNVRTLYVRGYGGVTFSPSWLTGPNLVNIALNNCTCERLGSLRKLPSLKVLDLVSLRSLKFIEEVDDASAGGGGFPSLEDLYLSEMHDLEGWSTSSSTPTPAAAVFPCLKSVEVHYCPSLRGGIPLAWSPVLQNVDIDGDDCNGMVLGSLRDLPSLPTLDIYGFDELEYFPSGALTNLTALHKLTIWGCNNLKALPVELISLVTLTELEISHCSNLVSLAEEREGGLKNLSTLKSLVIDDCEALKRLPELEKASLVTLRILHCHAMEFSKEDFEHLRVLEELQLVGLPKLTWFPEGIKHSAATLRHLKFQPCYADCAPVDLPDWIGTTLTSLEYLEIAAPKNWKMLPQWMRHLKVLKFANAIKKW